MNTPKYPAPTTRQMIWIAGGALFGLAMFYLILNFDSLSGGPLVPTTQAVPAD